MELRASLTIDGAAPIRAKIKEIIPEYVPQSETLEYVVADAAAEKGIPSRSLQRLVLPHFSQSSR